MSMLCVFATHDTTECMDGGIFSIFTNCFSCFSRRGHDFNLKEKMKILDEIVSDSDHREFVSAGVSAGISAAFGAPVGGVLFSMEEACSFWSRKTAWRCFIAATLSTFTIQLMNRRCDAWGAAGRRGSCDRVVAGRVRLRACLTWAR